MFQPTTAKQKMIELFSKADIVVNGPSTTDIQIRDDSTYSKFLAGGTLSIGELFMDGHWDVEDLAEVVCRISRLNLYKEIVSFDGLPIMMRAIAGNMQSKARSFMVAEQHYDLGNDLYEAMLDARMVYTCAKWDGAQSLEEAQENKLDLICRKLGLKAGDSVLDIGCGWGSFMKYAAEKYGVNCVGISVSREQTDLGRERCKDLPIEFVVEDYRDFTPKDRFDHIVSIEMIEAVGPKNFATYFSKAHEWLKPSGLFALQAIGSLRPNPVPDRWIDKYIFPNGVMPSLPQIEAASRGKFIIEHMENLGPDYDLTLMEWWRRFDTAYPDLKKNNPKYDTRFYRMWKFYLHCCAGLFRARVNQDWQFTLSPIHR